MEYLVGVSGGSGYGVSGGSGYGVSGGSGLWESLSVSDSYLDLI